MIIRKGYDNIVSYTTTCDSRCTITRRYHVVGRRGVIVWQLDLQLPMQSVPITTDVVSSNLDQGEVDNIM
jgi:hypothetical protein